MADIIKDMQQQIEREIIIFALLKELGVFNIKNGKAILNFNTEGVLTEVKFDITAYKKGFPTLQSLVNNEPIVV